MSIIMISIFVFRFRYSGRTQAQAKKSFATLERTNPAFERSGSHIKGGANTNPNNTLSSQSMQVDIMQIDNHLVDWQIDNKIDRWIYKQKFKLSGSHIKGGANTNPNNTLSSQSMQVDVIQLDSYLVV